MSESTTSQIVIEALPDAVVSVIAALEDYPQWTEGMRDVTVSRRDSHGRAVEASFDIAGGPITDHVTIAYEWQEHSVSWRLLDGKSITKLDGSYAWQQVGPHTEVTYRLAVDLSVGLPSFLRRAAEKTIVGTALQGLKKRVEHGNG